MSYTVRMLIGCVLIVLFENGCTHSWFPDPSNTVVYEPPQGKIADWVYDVTRGKDINDQLEMYEIHAQYTGTNKEMNSVEIQFGNGTIASNSVEQSRPIVMGTTLPKTVSHTPLTIKWTIGPMTQSQTIEVKLP